MSMKKLPVKCLIIVNLGCLVNEPTKFLILLLARIVVTVQKAVRIFDYLDL